MAGGEGGVSVSAAPDLLLGLFPQRVGALLPLKFRQDLEISLNDGFRRPQMARRAARENGTDVGIPVEGSISSAIRLSPV